jgi:hypothetical protein
MVLGATALPAAARTFCCTDDAGRRICGDILPVQCQRRAYQEFNSQGMLEKQYEAPMTAEQRVQREADQASRRAAERQADEGRRRDRALRASYASARDIDAKRDRLLAEANDALKLAESRRAEALARKQRLDSEAEFFVKKPMPAKLEAERRENQDELAALQATIDERKQDIGAIEARFAEEKQRYLRLGGKP